MSFTGPLEEVVRRATGGLGAVVVADDGETIDQFTAGDHYEIRLVGAHQGIILQLIQRAMENAGNGNRLEGVSITSDRRIFSVVPVMDGTFLVLVQDRTGIPSQGRRVLREAVPKILQLF